MARNEEKAQLMLNKWVTMKEQFNSGQAAERRPFLATDCSSLADCEKWRMQIVREVTKKVAAIQNAGLGEHKIRDLNDNINKLLREKGHWQRRIRDLGGPDYNALEPKALDAEGRPLPGGGGYRYFGAARDLPGVKELFEAPPPQKKRRTRGDMMRNVTPDYYGFRDDDDGGALKAQEAAVERPRVEEARMKELAGRAERRARNDGAESSDDDPLDEPALLDGIRRATDASAQAFEEVMGGSQDLAGRKRALLEALGADDDLRPAAAAPAPAAPVAPPVSEAPPVALQPADAGRPSAGGFSEHGDDAPADAPAAAPAKPSKKPAAKKPAAATTDVDEAPVAAPEPAPEPDPAPAAAPKWTVGEVNKMTVPKLKAALTELGLDTSGLKAVLKARLLEAL
jgi:pre-mRNA-splicing factor ISY1